MDSICACFGGKWVNLTASNSDIENSNAMSWWIENFTKNKTLPDRYVGIFHEGKLYYVHSSSIQLMDDCE